MAGELWIAPFGAGTAANLPTNYPADTDFAFYRASDTGQIYVAPKPSTAGAAAAWVGLGGGSPVAVPDGTTYTFDIKNSGRRHVIPDLTADCVFTLPAPTIGVEFLVQYGGAAADAKDWTFNTSATSVLFKGGLVHLDADAADAGDEVVPVFADFSNDDSLSVQVPSAGTEIVFTSDGTSWFVNGRVVGATAPAFS